MSLVNKAWCIVAVPILWKNPEQFIQSEKSVTRLFNVILLHLSKETRDILKNQEINNLI